MANNVNCEEMRFVIRNLVDVEDPPRQRRQKFLLMRLEATPIFPQRGRDVSVETTPMGSQGIPSTVGGREAVERAGLEDQHGRIYPGSGHK